MRPAVRRVAGDRRRRRSRQPAARSGSSGPVRPGQDLIVLLPDSDTRSTGTAGVSNPFGSVDLAAERDAALATANSAPVLTKLSEADVKRIFGDALSALPPAAATIHAVFQVRVG